MKNGDGGDEGHSRGGITSNTRSRKQEQRKWNMAEQQRETIGSRACAKRNRDQPPNWSRSQRVGTPGSHGTDGLWDLFEHLEKPS